MEWKHKIGDFVTPVVMESASHPSVMVVTGRVTEEYLKHVEHFYICSHFKLGDYIRSRVMESEIVPWNKPVK